MSKQVFSMDFYGKNLSVEIGELAKQANGSVLVLSLIHISQQIPVL